MNKLELLFNEIKSNNRKDIIIRIVNTIKKNPGITLNELSDRVHLTTKCISNYIKLLRDNEVLYPRKNELGLYCGYKVVIENALPIPEIKKK